MVIVEVDKEQESRKKPDAAPSRHSRSITASAVSSPAPSTPAALSEDDDVIAADDDGDDDSSPFLSFLFGTTDKSNPGINPLGGATSRNKQGFWASAWPQHSV